ncbi:hypothetical protein [Xanthomonas phage JGB6]|nr:hypothetical protein [Xanthomonas phage JGB6]
MEIQSARKKAAVHLDNNLLRNLARRQNPQEKVYTRYPLDHGSLIKAADVDDLREKLAKRIQARARRKSH